VYYKQKNFSKTSKVEVVKCFAIYTSHTYNKWINVQFEKYGHFNLILVSRIKPGVME
jgi:hypothetical protein